MKKILLFLLLLAGLASCNINPERPVRILYTGEKAFVELPHDLYRPTDTLVVTYDVPLDKWKVDTYWQKFAGNRNPSGTCFKAVFIQN